MPDIPIKHPGNKLYAWEVNALAKMAGMSLAGVGAEIVQGEDGKVVVVDATRPSPDEDVVFCFGDQDILQFGAVVLSNAAADGTTPLYELPRHCGYSGVGIAETPLDEAAGGNVRQTGIGWLCYNAQSVPMRAISPAVKTRALRPGDRLGVYRQGQYAEWEKSGPYEVMWAFEQDDGETWPESVAAEQDILVRSGWISDDVWDNPFYRLALVRLQRRERGAGVRCVQQVSGVGKFSGNFYAIEFGDQALLSELGVLKNGVVVVRARNGI